MDALLKLSESIRRLLETIALAAGWLLVIMACVTTFDVIARKLGVQLPYTKLQELEWHFHAAIFSLWMGYCYTINAHPRVDSFTEHLSYHMGDSELRSLDAFFHRAHEHGLLPPPRPLQLVE